MSEGYEKTLFVRIGSREFHVKVRREGGLWRFFIDGKELIVNSEKISGDTYSLIINGRSKEIDVERMNECFRVNVGCDTRDVYVYDMRRISIVSSAKVEGRKGEHVVKSPMPGKIAKVFVKEGDSVKRSQPVLTMEAMKMENEIRSPVDGMVKKLFVKPGEIVEGRADLFLVVEV